MQIKFRQLFYYLKHQPSLSTRIRPCYDFSHDNDYGVLLFLNIVKITWC